MKVHILEIHFVIFVKNVCEETEAENAASIEVSVLAMN